MISKDGKPVAALVDATLQERIRQQCSRCDALSERLAAGFAALLPEEGGAEIEAAIRAERSAP